ncbi:MAG: peptidoglycan synthetase [Saprospiraceae bacterium]|nr:peptidoglycan synthetase [Saprospiraceae bacterium]
MNKKVHFIAIGGAAMHNIAIDMHQLGYEVSGSDDEIYEPSLSRLKEVGILPDKMGWFPEKIHNALEFIVLGMHAKIDNPELIRAKELGVVVYSYPELVYTLSMNKKRVVVAGSHGKTTITSMILHVLSKCNIDFDYLVGAQIVGFKNMVRISDAPLIVLEGDEYLSSPVDLRPKIHHYHPHITVLTGIAWDHINVFPVYEDYKNVFLTYINNLEDNAIVIYNEEDKEVASVIHSTKKNIRYIPYRTLQRLDSLDFIEYDGEKFSISVIGNHNLSNMSAAMMVCKQLGISEKDFFNSIADFTGAAKRLQLIAENNNRKIFLDFAHAPSKVNATTKANKQWYGDKKLLAVFELHTFSSLDSNFLPQYSHTLKDADAVIVFYSEHTLKMKNKPVLDKDFVKKCFQFPGMVVLTDKEKLLEELNQSKYKDYNILLMTSGTFDQLDYKNIQ